MQEQSPNRVSLYYLIKTFLTVGSISFGGFMALISVIQKQMVEKDKVVTDQTIFDGISLASLLPGPVAVNTVCYVGYQLRGLSGALISMFAVLLPTFVLIVLLAFFYFQYNDLEFINQLLKSIMPGMVAIILSVGIGMIKKHLNNPKHYAILLFSFLILTLVGGTWGTFAVIIASAFIGIFLFKNPDLDPVLTRSQKNPKSSLLLLQLVLTFVIALSIPLLLSVCFYRQFPDLFSQNIKLATVFSGMSLSLFGGGYVIIPLIEEVIVGELSWLNISEFNSAIALSQITPGPILISATFIGFKVAGFLGALTATFSIFLPSGLLTIYLSHHLERLRDSPIVKAGFQGIRPAIVGLILAACLAIGLREIVNGYYLLIFLVSLFLLLRFKISSALILVISAVFGLIRWWYLL